MITDYTNCDNEDVIDCDFYLHKDCKNTCAFARRLNSGIGHMAETGQERFYHKYPNYPKIEEFLGVGAMMIDPTNLIKSITMEDKKNE
jgi:hypothetical protein